MKNNFILVCNDIIKSFNNKCIIDNFSYSFKNKGLYTIYGESGSGKTTLLNLLYKSIDIDSGSIKLYGEDITKLKKSELQSHIAYISQNNYFIDYLSVYDNLSLCTEKSKTNNNNIEYYLKYFNLLKKKDSFPCELSGGEKERIAIISAILQEKKIIFLDEPTSSLDKKTRKLLLDLLCQLKKNCLIICTTHDEALLNISDKKINLKEKEKHDYIPTATNQSKFQIVKKRKNNLLKYMLKQFSYKYREKLSTIILIIIFSISILIFNACFEYEKKIEQSLFNHYNINYVNYQCNTRNVDYCDQIIKQFNGVKNIFLYSENVPLGEYHPDLEYYEPVDYNLTAKTLPFQKDLFLNVNNLIKYGDYFENENDILIGIGLAEKLTDDPEKLINSEYDLKLFDKSEKFIIRGIFSDLKENIYIQGMSGKVTNNEIYFNDEYVKKYRYDNILGELEKNNSVTAMRAYFNKTSDLYKFYNDNLKCEKDDNICISKNGIIINRYQNNFIEFRWLIASLKYYLIPTAIIGFSIALIFFYQTENIKSKYHSYIISVYNSYGYTWDNIIINNILANIVNLSKVFIISIISSSILTYILNKLLLHFQIVDFKLFIINVKSIILLWICLVISSAVLSFFNSLILKNDNWITSLKNGDDFL